MKLDEALRLALLASDGITDLLGTWMATPAVHTARPIPVGASALPCIIVNAGVAVGNADYINRPVPLVFADISIYGVKASSLRQVEDLGWLVRELFHRKPQAVVVENYHTVSCIATGPIVGPTDDDKQVARIVTLTLMLTPERSM